MNSQFNTVLSIELIKAKSSGGKSVMKMKGIASTPSLDSDGEYLEPKGFEVEYFLKYGFMNWNHQTNSDPLSVVGKPLSAKVNRNGDFEIEFELFEKSAKAIQIYELQKILENQGMSLGLSIEGKVIERNPKDNRIVTKAQITACAITPNPKNQDTVTSIIKGQGFNKLSAYDEMSEEEREKALMAGSSSGSALSKESLNGSVKEIEKKTFSKAKFFEKVFRKLPSISIRGAQKMYELTYKIEKSLIMSEENKQKEGFVSEEAIQKALEILELQEPEAKQTPEGTEMPAAQQSQESADQEEEVSVKEPKQEHAQSSATEEEETEEETEEEDVDHRDAALVKARLTIEELSKALEVKTPSKKDPEPEIQKSIETETPTQSDNVLLKGIGELLKGEISGFKSEIDKKFQAVGTLTKSMTDQNAELFKRITNLEKEPQGRKSITTQSYVEKSFGDGDIKKGAQEDQLSISRHKRQICDLLTKSITGDEGITDQRTASEIMAFEQAGHVSKGLIQKAKDLGYALTK
jgi:hypothetical protein